MEAGKGCRTKLIDDTPATKDAFASEGTLGPHERVAKAIADVVLSSDEPGGKMIGLEGGWGSGKTTVVNLITRQLEESPDNAVILFDAWAHEGDPLRRTYLETLVKHLQEIDWVNRGDWKDHLDNIANRRKVTSKRTVPKPTPLGRRMGIAVLPVPFGVALVTAGLRNGVVWWPDRTLDPAYMFLIGAFVTLAPFVVLIWNLVVILWKRIVGCLRDQHHTAAGTPCKKTEEESKEKELSEWAFLLSDAISEEKTDTVETPDPTSNEFECYFGMLMDEALSRHAKRQVILVLDNLDRVDPDVALSIWSTLQTFLQEQHHRNRGWFKQLWIIVPYDPNGLRTLWVSRGVRSEGVDRDESKTPNDDPDEGRTIPQSFIDKSFLVRFEVPPPVLSNWRDFLVQLLTEALPNHEASEFRAVYQLFDAYRQNKKKAPTPRELILFVNQIGVAHCQWQDTIPLVHMAYYVLLRRSGKDVASELLNQSFPDKPVERFLQSSFRDDLAGLAFNVEPTTGRQLLLGDQMHGVLSRNDKPELERLEALDPTGFWAVLEQVTSTHLLDADARTISNSVLCLEVLDEAQRENLPELLSAKRSLCRFAKTISDWSPFETDIANALAIVCGWDNDAAFSLRIAEAVRGTLAAASGVPESDADVPDAVRPILVLVGKLRELGHNDAYSQGFELPVDAQGWAGACEDLKAEDPSGDFWKVFSPSVEFDEISAMLQKAVNAGQFGQIHLDTITVSEVADCESDWSNVVAASMKRLEAAAATPLDQVVFLLHALCEFRRQENQPAMAALTALATKGHLLHYYQLAKAENNVDAIAWIAFCFLRECNDAAKPAPAVVDSDNGHASLLQMLNSQDEEFANKFTELLDEYAIFPMLLEIADARGTYDAMIVRCLQIIADGAEPKVLYTPQVLLKRWDVFQEQLDEEDVEKSRFEALVLRLAQQTGLCKYIQESANGFIAEDAGLYLTIVASTEYENDEFREWCKRGLERLATEQWQRELVDESETLDLLRILQEQGHGPTLKPAYKDALVAHANAVMDRKITPSAEYVPHWPDIIKPLGVRGTRKDLASRLLDAALQRDGKISDEFFDCYGEEIADIELLKNQETVVSKLFSPIVRDRNVRALRWLQKITSENRDFLNEYLYGKENEEFVLRLQECQVEATEDDAHDLIVKIAADLRIEPPPPREAVEEDHAQEENGGDDGPAHADGGE